jgi:protein-disulfide isomerase
VNDDQNRDDVLMPDDDNTSDEKEKITDSKDKKEDALMTISPSMLMYALVAVTFLLVGIVIGTSLNQNSVSAAEVERIVRTVLAETDFTTASAGSETDRFELVDNDPYMGDENAPIVMVEFSDFFCPYCGRHYEQTLVPLLENYGKYIRYVYRDMAILSENSVLAAQAGECAAQQDKFWEFHNTFFTNQELLTPDYFRQVAQENGLDMTAFEACLATEATIKEVEADRIDGYINGVEGTPGFFINGNFVRGAQPYEVFEAYIVRELERAGIDPEADSAAG